MAEFLKNLMESFTKKTEKPLKATDLVTPNDPITDSVTAEETERRKKLAAAHEKAIKETEKALDAGLTPEEIENAKKNIPEERL